MTKTSQLLIAKLNIDPGGGHGAPWSTIEVRRELREHRVAEERVKNEPWLAWARKVINGLKDGNSLHHCLSFQGR